MLQKFPNRFFNNKLKQMQGKTFKIAAISGSLKKTSTHSGLIRAAIEAKNPHLDIQIIDISGFPLFNEDVEKEGVPLPVKIAFDKVKAADAILFANPQNNFSMSAPLKNAYDWLSRGGENAAVYKKPAAQFGTGVGGATRAADHLRQVVNYCKVQLLDEPRINIKRFEPGNFNDNGDLTNDNIKNEIKSFLQTFAEFIQKHHL